MLFKSRADVALLQAQDQASRLAAEAEETERRYHAAYLGGAPGGGGGWGHRGGALGAPGRARGACSRRLDPASGPARRPAPLPGAARVRLVTRLPNSIGAPPPPAPICTPPI
jgi:hypothetical protein